MFWTHLAYFLDSFSSEVIIYKNGTYIRISSPSRFHHLYQYELFTRAYKPGVGDFRLHSHKRFFDIRFAALNDIHQYRACKNNTTIIVMKISETWILLSPTTTYVGISVVRYAAYWLGHRWTGTSYKLNSIEWGTTGIDC